MASMNDVEGAQDNGGPWSDVQNRKNRKSKGDGVERTFLVQNISDRVTRNVLWRAFQPYGFVSDVYVARKRDARGRCFGFVRYVGVGNMKETLVAMNTVRMFDMKAIVSLAKYDKDHKRFNYSPDNLGRSEWRPKESYQTVNNGTGGSNSGQHYPLRNKIPSQGPVGSSFVQEGTSYADLLKGNKVDSGHGAKVVDVAGKGSLYPLHCIGRSLLGHTREIMSLSKLRQLIEGEGMTDVGLSFVGGMTFMITFKDKVYASTCMDLHSQFFETVFSKFSLWNGEDIPFTRLANLNLSGVPFIIRDNNLFDRIGELFGVVVRQSSFSWPEEDNSVGSVTVLTSKLSKIDEAVVIKWNNKSVVIWVSESPGQWHVGSNNKESESLLDSDSESEWASDGDSEDMEDLEEGEIKQGDTGSQDDVQIPAVEMVDDVASERPEPVPVENERLHDNQGPLEDQTPSGVNAGGKEQKGERNVNSAAHAGEINDVNVGNFSYANHVEIEGPNSLLPGLNSIGPTIDMAGDGPTPLVNLGKRNRMDRSPPSIGSTQGPPQRSFYYPEDSNQEQLDLNTPVRAGPEIMVDVDVASEIDVNAPLSPVTADDPGSGIPVSGNDRPVNNDVRVEVEETVHVGSLIGVDLNGFESMAEQIIVEEGANNNSR
ncbi:putative RNA recognition motif domain, nucleotide-binding alpha-beta plait domain superfamily [Helianthus annuus]|uniref:RNA recognition motif domain, nucleotide-binding alpha-beta plait domain superfamily n=1 Tax=Helianthus annuus TaxID=4232 RepID=A0A9K3J924_HELAN|nr:putative RNA recognition motif domain, nucleotide-binding alpha-beta plait domain superfamily [Helianthus annuus]KAJ0580946.1 putative RNA recognition motif domain, nucleotide-binding alpha-beta plait domain superfamily [Helianthus annuus]KAJ0588696.1 putative RNA recognition motif domain, nucleotide-binding alpha-beta plait domain superfamily [Helianthus annuus]KAJ0596887.1 putative RNA recognition motif domain, nucleotide-binding alpha-beta plait domain superfamily [Helianthus annuus]KAJ07